MQVTDKQIELLRSIKESESNTEALESLFTGYIDEIKDGVLDGKMKPETGKEVVAALKDFVNKLMVIGTRSADGKPNKLSPWN
jgi:hypothetical protein